MKKRIITIAGLLIIVAVLTSACNRGLPEAPDVDAVKAELVSRGTAVTEASFTIKSVNILDTVIHEDIEIMNMEVEVISDNGETAHKRYFELVYWYNSDKEWECDAVYATRESDWAVTPATGVSNDVLRTDLLNTLRWESVTIDDEIWQINEDNFGDAVVDSRETKLDQCTDTITVTVTIDDEVLIATGQLQVDYVFTESNGWFISDYRSVMPFIATVKPEAVHEFNDETALAEVLSMRLPFEIGSSWNRETQQIIDIADNEVSDFTCDEIVMRDRGRIREYHFTFTVDKQIVVFNASVVAKYIYERANGWSRDDFEVDLTVVSADFEGTVWVGEHIFQPLSSSVALQPPRPMTLEITDIASNGAMYAIIRYDLEDRTVEQKLEGSFNMEELTFELSFKEWISSPVSSNYFGRFTTGHFEKSIDGFISVGDLSVKTNRHTNYRYHDFDLAYAPDGIGNDDNGGDDNGGDDNGGDDNGSDD